MSFSSYDSDGHLLLFTISDVDIQRVFLTPETCKAAITIVDVSFVNRYLGESVKTFILSVV